MKFTVNGKEYSLERDTVCCEEMLDKVGISKDGLIAEIDGRVFTVTQFSEAVVKDGSKVELIRIMGGG